jgi:AcrR family transcriptional regulator
MSIAQPPVSPRSNRVHSAILDAAVQLVMERGYERTSIEAIAARAKVSKTTIYRWWESRSALAIDAFLTLAEVEFRAPNTGSAELDFRAQITELGQTLQGPCGRVLAALLCAARTDFDLASELKERWLGPRKKWAKDRMTSAERAQELREGLTPSAGIALLYGPLCLYLMFGSVIAKEVAVKEYLDIACAAVFRPERDH